MHPGKSIFLSRQPGCERSFWASYMVYIIINLSSWAFNIVYIIRKMWTIGHTLDVPHCSTWLPLIVFFHSYCSEREFLTSHVSDNTFSSKEFRWVFGHCSDQIHLFHFCFCQGGAVWLKNPAQAQCRALFNRYLLSFKKETSQELPMLSRSPSDCKSLLLNVMIQVSQFVSNCQLSTVTKSLIH